MAAKESGSCVCAGHCLGQEQGLQSTVLVFTLDQHRRVNGTLQFT